MKQLIRLITILTVLTANPAFAALEQVPGVMAAPVVLYDEGSNILTDGQYHVMVAFTDSLDTTLFTEEQVVDVRNGVALISIGNGYAVGSSLTTSSGGLTASIFDVSTDIAVEILVEGQTNPQELTILGSQPYAFIAQKAMTVADGAITSTQIRDGSIHEEDLDEAFLAALQESTVVVQNDDGSYDVVDLDASQVGVSSDIGLNNASGATLDIVLRDLDGAIDTLRGTDLDQSLDSVNTNLEDHSSASSGVHGVTGNVVGTSDTQSLQNKTLDSTNSISGDSIKSGTISDARVPAIGTHAALTSGVHGVSGNIVGTTDTQTLQNKTLDSTNSIAAEAIKSGQVADAYIPTTITRDSELAFSNLSGSLSTAQFPENLGRDVTFDDASCTDGSCKVDGVDVSALNSEVSDLSSDVTAINEQLNSQVLSISDQLDDDIDDSRISAYIRPLAYGYMEGTSGCSSIDLVSGYNVESVSSSTETTRIRLSEPLAQASDLIIMLEENSDPTTQDDLDHDCLRGYGYQPSASAGTTSLYVAHCSSSSACSSISEKKFSFVVYQIPR